MDKITVTLEDLSYIVEISKEPNPNSFSDYSKYICHIKFINNIGQVLVDITTNEISLFNFIITLSELQYCGDYYDNIVNFNHRYFIYIAILPPFYTGAPIEEDEYVHFQVFEESIQGNQALITFKLSFPAIEDFIFAIFRVIQDIKYLHDIDFGNLIGDLEALQPFTSIL